MQTDWRGYPCPDPACRAHNPETNPTLCASCQKRLSRIIYVSCDPRAPGMDLLLLQLLERQRIGEPGLQAGMSERWEATNA